MSSDQSGKAELLAVLVEQYKAAHSEIIKRIEWQLKAIQIYGVFLAAIYSGAVVSGRYELLFFVGPFSGLIALYWTDRQGIIILLRSYLANEMETKKLSKVLQEEDKTLAQGWLCFFERSTYYPISKAAHLRMFVVVFILALLPSMLFCYGCLFPDQLKAFEELKVYEFMGWYGDRWYGRFLAGSVVFVTIGLFLYTYRVFKGQQRVDRQSSLE